MPENERTWVDDLFEEVIAEAEARKAYVPKVGDTIYVPSCVYGEVEGVRIRGGKAEILRVNQIREPEADCYTY